MDDPDRPFHSKVLFRVRGLEKVCLLVSSQNGAIITVISCVDAGPTPANYLADSVVFQTHAVQPEDPVVFTNQCPIPPPASNLGRPNLSEIKSFGPLRPTAVPPTQDEKNKPVINGARLYLPSNHIIDLTKVIEALSDAAWAELKDLSKVITLLDTEAANTFGHFCDLFVGVHSSLQLKVALKRPRISKQGYSEADIKVSALIPVDSQFLTTKRY